MPESITEASVFLYSGYEGYLPDATLVFSGTELGSRDNPVVLKRSGSNYLLVADGGQAEYVTVSDYDSYAEIMAGGAVRQLTITGYGAVTAHERSQVSNVEIKAGSQLSLAGMGNAVSVAGVLSLSGSADAVDVLSGGVARLSGEDASLSNVGSMAGQLDITDGAARNVTVSRGGHVYISGGALDKAVFQDGSALDVLTGNPEGWILSDATFHRGAFARLYSGTILEGTIHLGINLSLQGVVDASGATVDFLLTERTGGEAPFISDWEKCSTGKISLTVSGNQSAGKYALADDASSFAASVALHCDSFESVYMGEDGIATCHDHVYTLMLQGENDTLFVDVAAYQTTASASGLSWADINGAASYVLEMGGAQFDIASKGVDLLGLANGDYAWRVRNAVETDNWQDGKAFTQTEAAEGPQKLEAVPNNATDLFFARMDGVWGSDYLARHVGNKGGWAGTGETVDLTGKARITDIFAGSEDASILKLALQAQNEVPEAQASGVALFLDDIYSAASGTAEQARLSQINTILATEGADIIDLTSQRFDFAGGVTVHGGAGDDVIWANSGENMLFGGDGDDRIIGGSDDDIIGGGAGNDTLHGGGGNDIFCFGENWGQDTVSQLSGGAVTLWFSQSNETLQLDFTADSGDTLITAASGDTIRAAGLSVSIDDCVFGAAAGYETKYNSLASAGVFA